MNTTIFPPNLLRPLLYEKTLFLYEKTRGEFDCMETWAEAQKSEKAWPAVFQRNTRPSIGTSSVCPSFVTWSPCRRKARDFLRAPCNISDPQQAESRKWASLHMHWQPRGIRFEPNSNHFGEDCTVPKKQANGASTVSGLVFPLCPSEQRKCALYCHSKLYQRTTTFTSCVPFSCVTAPWSRGMTDSLNWILFLNWEPPFAVRTVRRSVKDTSKSVHRRLARHH